MPCLCLSLPTPVVPADTTIVLPDVIAAHTKNSNRAPHGPYCGETFMVLLSPMASVRLHRGGADRKNG